MRKRDTDKTPFVASALIQGAQRRRLGNALAAVSVAVALAGAAWGAMESKALLGRQEEIALDSDLASALRAAMESRQDIEDARNARDDGEGRARMATAAGQWGLSVDRYERLGVGRSADEKVARALMSAFAQEMKVIGGVGTSDAETQSKQADVSRSLGLSRLAQLRQVRQELQDETTQRLRRAQAAFVAWALTIAVLVGWAMAKERSASRQVEDLALRLAHEATHDALTGLPNRRYLHARLDEAWASFEAGETGLCALYMDLDGFSQINNTLGHEAGDQALNEVALACGRALGPKGFLARMGGDEFVALCFESEAQAMLAGQAMVDEVSALAPVEGVPVGILGVSVGVACASDGWDGPAELMAAADEAMYQAKRDGKRCVRVAEALKASAPSKASAA